MGLDIDDLPEIPIEKIYGLKRLLDRIQDPIKTSWEKAPEGRPKRRIDAGSALKVTWNEQGEVTGWEEVLPRDLPALPVDKIIGLSERLRLLETREMKDNITDDFRSSAGSAPKVIWDNKGRVLRGEKLTMADMPRELSEELTAISNRIVTFASQETVNNWIIESKKKVNGLGKKITAGTYSKLTINEDGLVVSGEQRLTIKDLPELGVRDIVNLEKMLRDKMERSEMLDLQSSLNTLLSYDSKNEIQRLNNQLRGKAETTAVSKIAGDITTIRREMEQLEARLPRETLPAELRQVVETLTTIQGQVLVIGRHLNLDDQFCKIPEGKQGD
jgi:hypothetical protein